MPVEQLIYTDRPRGKGLDPASSGYQIKACSEGMAPEARRQLDNICMHYGDAAYQHAPRDAKESELQWRTRADQLKDVPEHILNDFPVIWSYDRLDGEQFALTRINYIGITHDGRFGNFLAHSLALTPDDLAGRRFNPLSLSRANLFKSRDTSDETKLPAIEDVGSADGNRAAHRILRDQLFSEHLPAMVASLCRATPASRPVLICLSNWQQAAQLIEALLDLLPPSARSRTTFCTYESDRKYLVPTPAGPRPKDLVAAHHLIALCAKETRHFDLRPDEYRSTFAIFNFIDGLFSEPGEITRYAEFAAECALDDNKLDRLQNHHDLVERLDAGMEQQAWSALIPAVGLYQPQLHHDALMEGARTLGAVAQSLRQAEVALTILQPHVCRLAQANAHEKLDLLAHEVAKLSDRSDAIADEIFALLWEAFTAGQGRTVAALLRAAGSARERMLLALLNHAIGAIGAIGQEPHAFPPALAAEDRERIIELLLDGLRLAGQPEAEAAPPLDELLTFSFYKASELGLAAELWNRGGGPAVKARLSGEMDQARGLLLLELAALLPGDQCPTGSAWLNLQFLKAEPAPAPVSDREMIAGLELIARAGSRSDEAETFIAETLRLAEGLEQKPLRAEALGRMAAAARDTASEKTYLSAYQECRAEITDPQQIKALRARLAEARAITVMVHELRRETIPWEEKGDKGFNAWLDSLRNSRARGDVLDGARQDIAASLLDADEPKALLDLAKALLTGAQEKPSGKGAAALGEAIIFALSPGPLNKGWDDTLSPLAGGLKGDAQKRLRALKFMREITDKSRKPGWSLKELSDHSAWRDVAELSSKDKSAVVGLYLETFNDIGVTEPKEAEALVKLFRTLSSKVPIALPQAVAGAVHQLLTNRGPVTKVNVAMTFVRCGLGESREPWGEILRAILDPFDKQTKRLFEEHLEDGFHRFDPKAEARLRQLRADAGLPPPKPPAPAKDAETGKTAQETKGARAGVEKPATGILDKIGLGKLGGAIWGRTGKSAERGNAESSKPEPGKKDDK